LMNSSDKGKKASKRNSARVGTSSKEYSSALLAKKNTQEPRWSVQVSNFTPPRMVSDQELQQAKRLFWELDRDNSGSIEADEITYMLRSLGQNPTLEGVTKLIERFDDGEKDGKIQLREFLQMYANGLDNQNSSSYEDVLDSFRALEVEPSDEKARVPKEKLSEYMKTNYELDLDIDEMFGSGSEQELSLKHFESFLNVAKGGGLRAD